MADDFVKKYREGVIIGKDGLKNIRLVKQQPDSRTLRNDIEVSDFEKEATRMADEGDVEGGLRLLERAERFKKN